VRAGCGEIGAAAVSLGREEIDLIEKKAEVMGSRELGSQKSQRLD